MALISVFVAFSEALTWPQTLSDSAGTLRDVPVYSSAAVLPLLWGDQISSP